MLSFSCNFLPNSLFVGGEKFGRSTKSIVRSISVKPRYSYVPQVPVSVCKYLQIRSLCSGRNTSRLNSVAHELLSVGSLSSKSQKKILLKAKLKEGSDGAVAEGKKAGDGRSMVNNRSKKRDKSTVCNNISGQVNVVVSGSIPSTKKITAKNSKPVNSSTGNDSESSQKAIEDVLGTKQSAKSNGKVPGAKSPIKKNQKPKNKKQDKEKVVLDGIELAKSNGEVHSGDIPVKRTQKRMNNKQVAELSSSSFAAMVVESSKRSGGNPTSTDTESHVTKCDSSGFSLGGSDIKKFGPLYPPSGKSVVVVESVTKARVIQGYLGDMYEVLPSYGHLRDLAGRSGSVRPDDDFSMVWEVPASAWTHLKRIKVALNG